MAALPLWFKQLTPELQKYAEDTLGETPEKRTKALSDFRILIKEKKSLNCRDDDTFLLAFLRPKKFDVTRAFKVLNNYYDLRAKHRGVFTEKLPSEVRIIADMKAALVLPLRLPPGSHINFMKIGNMDLKKSSAHDFTAFLIVLGEILLECEASQVCGAVNIFDFRDFSFQHCAQFLTMSYISLILSITQDCWPERIRAIHILFEPTLLRIIYKIFKPVLTTKLKEKIYIHGENLEHLYQHVPQDYLPEELGGNLGPLDNTDFLSYFMSQESFIKKIISYGLIDNKKPNLHDT